MVAFNADPNPFKINGGMGHAYADGSEGVVLHDDTGIWVADSVWEAIQETPSYVSGGYLSPDVGSDWVGVEDFLVGSIIAYFGEFSQQLLKKRNIAMASTVGGTGGLYNVAIAQRDSHYGASEAPYILMSTPGYGNHRPIWEKVGLGEKILTYNHLTANGQYDFSGHMDAIRKAPNQSVVLFQTVDNPTGMAPSHEQWEEIAKEMSKRNQLAVVDIAYPGFGKGFVQDTEAVRILMKHHVRVVLVGSFSKIGSGYNGRTGFVGQPTADATTAREYARIYNGTARGDITHAPATGQEIIANIYRHAGRTERWLTKDLDEYRGLLQGRKAGTADLVRGKVEEYIVNVIADSEGPYFTLPINPAGVAYLQKEHSIYIVDSGRVNMASILTSQVPKLAEGIVDVMSHSEFIKPYR